ncbi:MAG TPA: MBL fold metallo-hydrolase [Chitinophagaceae bacterium]|nr:MBL fold metallo-hydrolase [Chitinophagaceae bacterium]
MFFQHIYDQTLAQGSYVIGCQQTGEALVIDAKRDIDTYLEVAKENELKITCIAETHIHADFLCGSRELAAVTGAKMYLSDEGGEGEQYEFSHEGMHDGDLIHVGNLSLKVLHTPGHTPESVSFLLTDHPASEEPVMIFTGDFVFVGDVGRPDLLEESAGMKGTKEEGAKQMFASLQLFLGLPDFVQVWPAHGAGSACGKSLGAVPSSTVGYEKKQNWALQFGNDEKGFIDKLLEGQPEPPRYFSMMKVLNKVARPLKIGIPKIPLLTKNEFEDALDKGLKVIDARSDEDFGDGHLPGTINIQNTDAFATWMGWMVDYQEPFVLIAKEEEIEEIARKLMRIGLDNVYGYFSNLGDFVFDLDFGELMETDDVKQLFEENKALQIVDVRGSSEYASGHIKGAKHVFVATLEENLDQLDKDKETVVYCQSGMRSALAYSLLKKNGYENVKNYCKGMTGWLAAGCQVI